MEWYVLRHDFNNDSIERFNIFNNTKFKSCVDKALKKYIVYDLFKEDVRSALFYAFASKVEYEMLCRGFLEKSEEYKIDVYQQVLPNLDILCKYIIEKYNEKKRKKIEV